MLRDEPRTFNLIFKYYTPYYTKIEFYHYRLLINISDFKK